MVIELRLPVCEFSTRISKFYTPLILNTNLIKQESKIDYPYDQSGIILIGNPQLWSLHYVQVLMRRVLRFSIPIHKVLK